MVLLRDRWPAYISWEDHERNCAQVTANRAGHAGVPRGGPSLLAGLLACGRCGRRMATRYPQGGRYLRYGCAREAVDHGGPACQSLSGRGLDALVGGLIVEALAPAAVEASLQLAEDVELERAALQRQWRQRLERARYEAERARRQYDAVDPENRLVARSLERQWERALAEELRLRAEHERFVATRPVPPTTAELAAIRRLTEDIPALWHAPTTTAHDRQAIARLLLERVVVTVEGESERVAVACHWAGGVRTEHALTRPVKRLGQLSTCRALLERIGDLHAAGSRAPAIAATLNREGWRPPKRRATFTAGMVRGLLRRRGVAARGRRRAVPDGRAAVPRGGDAAGAGRTPGDAGADGLSLAAAWRACGRGAPRSAGGRSGSSRRTRTRSSACGRSAPPARRPEAPVHVHPHRATLETHHAW